MLEVAFKLGLVGKSDHVLIEEKIKFKNVYHAWRGHSNLKLINLFVLDTNRPINDLFIIKVTMFLIYIYIYIYINALKKWRREYWEKRSKLFNKLKQFNSN